MTSEGSREYDEVILKHYEGQAKEFGLGSNSTMLDLTVRQRETALIKRFLSLSILHLRGKGYSDSDIKICDVGCGNGYSLLTIAEDYPEVNVLGIEFTPALRKLAQSRFSGQDKVKVAAGDIRTLDLPDESFDIVICQRVLINLLDLSDQIKAISELSRITRQTGFILSIEAFQDPLINLNSAREEFNLPELPAAYHNSYLPSDIFDRELSLTKMIGPDLDIDLPTDFLPSNFLSSHYFISRVLHPIALGGSAQFVRNSYFVHFLTEAIDKPIGDFAPIKAHAFRKSSADNR